MLIPNSWFVLPIPTGNPKLVFWVCGSTSVLWISSLLAFFIRILHTSRILGHLSLSDFLYLVWSSQVYPIHFSSVTWSSPTLCDPMDCSMPGLPVHHQLLELAQTHVHWVGDAILCCSLLLLPSVFHSIRVFSNCSTIYNTVAFIGEKNPPLRGHMQYKTDVDQW